MLGGLMMKETGLVLDVARQVGGAMPGVVTLPDHSRFGNHGAMTNVTWVQLPSGLWVMNFNGTTAWVNCGNDISLDVVWPFSVALWINFGDIGNGRQQFIGKAVGANGFTFEVDNARDQVDFYSLDGGWALISTNTHFLNDQWNFLVAVNTGTQKAIYTNGALDCVPSAEGVPTSSLAGNLAIGARGDDLDRWFEGMIGLPRLYSYALTAGQILKHYEATRRSFGV